MKEVVNEEVLVGNDVVNENKDTNWFIQLEMKMKSAGRKDVLEIISELKALESSKESPSEERQEKLNAIKEKVEDFEQEIAKELGKKIKTIQTQLDRAIPEAFGSLVKHYRERAKLTLRDLENLTGISASYINRLEKGQRNTPTFPMIEKLATALKVSVEDLLPYAKMKKNSKKRAKTILEVILSEEDMTSPDGTKLSRDAKEEIAKIISSIFEKKFDASSQLQDTLQLISYINNLKSLI